MHDKAISLSQLNAQIKDSIRSEFDNHVWIIAEINQLNQHSSGHCYLELVEKSTDSDTIKASIRGTIWASAFQRISAFFKSTTGQYITSGIKVLIKVQVDFHEIYGISLNVRDIDPNYTLGDMARNRAEIIRKLDEAGVSDMNKDLELPRVPQTIAIISSPSAAGYEDFCEQLGNNPNLYSYSWKLFPAVMQGEKTSQSIIKALDKISDYEHIFDIVVIIRGGGSKTDLSFYDDFDLAFNISQFPIPVISGIGHDRDESVVDLVAHTSCKTPTAVAEFILDLAVQFDSELEWLKERISREARKSLNSHNSLLTHQIKALNITVRYFQEDNRSRLNELILRTDSSSKIYISELKKPLQRIESGLDRNVRYFLLNKRTSQERVFNQIHTAVTQKLSKTKHELDIFEKQCLYLNPQTILKRGYSISYFDGKPIKNVNVLKKDDIIETKVNSGKFKSRIE